MAESCIVTRFAPSPTGHLHKGHAYSALAAYSFAREHGGRFLLRIEDIDPGRCRPEHIDQIYEDLRWLGLEWEIPVRIQSEHREDYDQTAKKLEDLDLLYPCFCTRSEILREAERAGYAPHANDGPLYPGTCRDLSRAEQEKRIATGIPYSVRLNLEKALSCADRELLWQDTVRGSVVARPDLLGDTILVRKDIGTSYHLAVVTDDALQGITDIVRGIDLFESTHLHRLLQALLHLPVPVYHHHELLSDEAGNRLAKRNLSVTLKSLRESGVRAESLREEFGL